MNRDDSYWIFSDDPAAALHVTSVTVAANSVDNILLATDGYAAPTERSDDRTVVRARLCERGGTVNHP
jgi:hypothetical protein